MFEDISKIQKKQRRFFRSMPRSIQDRTSRPYTADEVRRILLDSPELRLADDPAHVQLAQMLMACPDDPDLQEMFTFVVDNKNREFACSGDVFFGNYWPQGSLNYPEDFLQLAQIPNGDWVGLTVSQLRRNVLFAGPTGSAKSTALKVLLSNPKLIRSTRVVLFVKKREFRGFLCLPEISGLVIILQLPELQISFGQPPPGVKASVWFSELSKISAQSYGKYSAQRLVNAKLSELSDKYAEGCFPALCQLVEALDAMKCHVASRLNLYRESMLVSLNDLLQATGPVFNYSCSNFLNTLFATPGLAVVECETLPQEHLTFVATYFTRWEYCQRLYSGRGAM
jgi:hypothetical protein